MNTTAPLSVSAAEAAIGVDDPKMDWILRPQTHAAQLPKEAGPLKRILSAPDLKLIMDRYVEHDDEADRQQTRYRKGRRRLRFLAYAAVLSGIFALSLHLILDYMPDLQPVLAVLHVVLVLSLTGVAAWLNQSDPRRKWLAARGEAEQLRVALFDHVLAAGQDVHQSELPLLPLKLAYFRRYQLDVQERYFSGRGKELALDRIGPPVWLAWPAAAIALVVLVPGLIFLAHVAHEYRLPVPDSLLLLLRMDRAEAIVRWAFSLLVLSTLYAALISQSDISEDARAGARYLAHAANLKFLRTTYDDVRKRAEAGDAAVVERFVGLVHGMMIAEQSQWISFQGLVDHKDALLARRSATGLAELFAGQFAPRAEPSDKSRT